MIDYIPKSTKSETIRVLLNEAIYILEGVGIPTNSKTPRELERMAVCFLAVAGVRKEWLEVLAGVDGKPLKTRSIIQIVNRDFEETMSPGSYDAVRKKDLKLLVIADLVVNSGIKAGAATNDPTRGYSLHPHFRELLSHFKAETWPIALEKFLAGKQLLSETLRRNREIARVPVKLPSGDLLELSEGKHNDLQKAIVEEFLPRFGSDCEVLYLGDTSKKILHLDKATLIGIGFAELAHEELPDIIAFSKKNNWLYLIEAVHSTGPMSELRVLELRKMAATCTAELIFVTAFLTRADFKKWAVEIAWETEVWIADNPDHLIHFNGHKFLGAYS